MDIISLMTKVSKGQSVKVVENGILKKPSSRPERQLKIFPIQMGTVVASWR
jgi:hypothetical protein